MKNIIKNYYRLNFIVAIIIEGSILLNIFTISIFEKSNTVHLKTSDNVVLSLGGGLLKVYKSINIPIIKITNNIFGLSVYENNLTNKNIVTYDYFLCQDGGGQKATRLSNLSVNILLLNYLFKVIKSTRNFIKFILLLLLLMLIFPRSIPIRGIRNKILKTQLYKL